MRFQFTPYYEAEKLIGAEVEEISLGSAEIQLGDDSILVEVIQYRAVRSSFTNENIRAKVQEQQRTMLISGLRILRSSLPAFD